MQRGRAVNERAAQGYRWSYVLSVPTFEREPAQRLHIWSPDEAVAHARPLPAPAELVVDGVTPEEWEAFYEALAET